MFKKNSKNNQLDYLYSEDELEKYEKFIIENYGEFKEVIYEIVSLDIHLDIIVIPPTEENNYYKLITMGMGAYEMNIPKELNRKKLCRAELVMYLPPTWNLKSDKEEDTWPINCLKTLGRLPLKNNSWLGVGHTVSLDNNNSPFANNTKLCSMFLLPALNNKYKEPNLKIKNKGKINFYQLFPIYSEELNFIQNNDPIALFEKFDENDMEPIVNIKRKNYCAK